jgi:hypothetical protein
MNRFFTKSLVLVALVGAMTAYSTSQAEATFSLSICNDALCAGGDDLTIVDNGAGDTTNLLNGSIVWVGSFNGMDLNVDTALSKPILTSGMDLNFSATNIVGVPASVWLVAFDDNFLAPGALHSHIGGTVDTGTVQGTVCATPGSCVSSSVFGSGSYSEDFSGFGPTGTPYSLALIVAILDVQEGDTSSGDFRVVPEPVTLSLLGLGLTGLAVRRRRRVQ